MISLAIACVVFTASLDVPTLRDPDGVAHAIAPQPGDRAVVVAFLGVECPLAKLYASRLSEMATTYQGQGVRFVGVDANPQDDNAELRTFAAEHQLSFPLMKDVAARTAKRLGATRTPEVVVLDATGQVRYRGRVDDQYLVGVHRGEATSHDLQRALDELLAGEKVSVPKTAASGCLITFDSSPKSASRITYNQHVAPLLVTHCVECHQPGRSGPMSLTDYDEVVGWAAMIDEVVASRRMPPWHADRHYGHFANDPSLSDHEVARVRRWIADGCPRGDLSSTIAKIGTEPTANDWAIGTPDVVLSLPREFVVPATGLVDYQYFTVDPKFTRDQWVSAIEIRPSNRRVVHHCNVFVCPPGSDEVASVGELGSFCLAAMAAGTQGTILPPGMAKRIPAGATLRFVVHYTTVGTEQRDRTQLGLRLADPDSVTREVATRAIVDLDLNIPPYAADYRVEHTATIERDLLLLAMFPHMHLRGKSFNYEAAYPDGHEETLLSVPRWDFNWQHRYELAEPKMLPAGTTLRCIAVYDNSAANLANPDPSVTVHTGERTDDEMFNGYYDVAPLEAGHPARETRWPRWVAAIATLMLAMVAVRACIRR
jgi:peroxiredoxin